MTAAEYLPRALIADNLGFSALFFALKPHIGPAPISEPGDMQDPVLLMTFMMLEQGA